jgi:hypothetical protein
MRRLGTLSYIAAHGSTRYRGALGDWNLDALSETIQTRKSSVFKATSGLPAMGGHGRLDPLLPKVPIMELKVRGDVWCSVFSSSSRSHLDRMR